MMRLTLLIWAVAAPTIAGIGVLTVLVIPSLAEQDMQLILPAALLGMLVAIPVSYTVAKAINQTILN